MPTATQELLTVLQSYHYLALFFLAIIEGPFITVLTGFLTSLGVFHFFLAYTIIVFSDVFGDSIYYFFGRYGSSFFVKTFGKFFGVTPEKIAHLEERFHKHAIKILVFGKMTLGVGVVPLFVAGVAKYPFSKFLWYNLLPSLPKTLFFLLIGYYFGQLLPLIQQSLDTASALFITLTLLFLVVFLVVRFLKKVYQDTTTLR